MPGRVKWREKESPGAREVEAEEDGDWVVAAAVWFGIVAIAGRISFLNLMVKRSLVTLVRAQRNVL
jgi:hypothetical protein